MDRGQHAMARHRRVDCPAQRGVDAPVLAGQHQHRLPAGRVLLRIDAHGIGDGKAMLARNRPRARQRGVPAHRIAGHRHHLEPIAVDAEEIEIGRGVNQRRRNIAARVERRAELGRPVQFAKRRRTTPARRASNAASSARPPWCRAR
jgi:hypothetical protein